MKPYETSQYTNHFAIWGPSEGGRNSQRKNHQALASKGETHLTSGQESNQGCSKSPVSGEGHKSRYVEYANVIWYPTKIKDITAMKMSRDELLNIYHHSRTCLMKKDCES